MKEYLSDYKVVLAEIDSTDIGLSSDEAKRRLEANGPNKLNEGKKVSIIRKFFEELTDPMIIILIVAAVVSGVTSVYSGESLADVFIILAVVIINAVLGVIQENKAEKAIEALQEITAATSKVLRDGKMTVLRSDEIVIGDVVILEAGDSVPADCRIIECASIKAEEAALTGESVPVNKTYATISALDGKDVPLGDRKNMLYMGSTVVYGHGRAVVTATGMDTEMGKIANALESAQKEETPLQKKLNQLSKILTVLVLTICAAIFVIDIVRDYPNITGTGMLDNFMVAVSLAVAAIPEGLAAVVTIVLSIGVTKMSKRNAVIRRLTAVETLGCTQIICSDKTGTLTQNKMTVVEHSSDDKNRLVLAMALCSDAKLDENNEAIGEPTECALVNDAYKMGLSDEQKLYIRIGEAPFDSSRKMMSTVCKKESSIVQFTKGAPDEVLKLCTSALTGGKVVPMTDSIRESITEANKSMASKALRVLCAAERTWNTVPVSYEISVIENNLCYIGLCGMIDPVRPEVLDAIAQCKSAGVRPIMITGDHRDTAVAIATELGIITDASEAITGTQLDEISDKQLTEDILKYSVYARVQPEHKVRIVNAWKSQGKITAMTGDGVNDAPSIKSADIGIGMGITGTDVTKNVADMVLVDDNFATIVSAVEEGRRIYANIRKAIQFLLSANLAEVLSVFFATMMSFIILKPVHLLWINLVTDCFPALALGMEKGEKDIMQHPPRSSKDGIFAGGMGVDIAIQGIIITALTLVSYFVGHFIKSGVWEIPGAESPDGITMAFLTLSLVEIFHSFNMRSRRSSVFTMKSHNKWLWISMLTSFVLTSAVIYLPFLRDAFGFVSISLEEYVIAILIAIVIIPVMEIIKLCQRIFSKGKNTEA
ncbi:MAG: cation-translocating P-type ATPase [Clostridia bacterium]|nr:cation-translocating P-type ATPase [Clostridia bacterium]